MNRVRIFSSIWIAVGLTLGALISSCAQNSKLKLPDGSTSTPAQSFLSSAQMEARGKNGFGIPVSSFVFYPRDFSPLNLNELGETKDNFYSKNKDSNWCPGNIPRWDRSCFEGYSSVNCVELERLFVLNWGWKSNEIGLRESDREKRTGKGHQDCRYAPSGFWITEGNQIALWDERNGVVKEFSYSGGLERVTPSNDFPAGLEISARNAREFAFAEYVSSKVGKVKYESRCKAAHMNINGAIFWLEGPRNQGGSIAVANPECNVKCKVYLPQSDFEFGEDGLGRIVSEDGSGIVQYCHSSICLGFQRLHGRVDKNGDVIALLVDEQGIAVYRYRVIG